MVNYKEILRLLHEGYSQREIERSLHTSRRKIREFLDAAAHHNIAWPLEEAVTNEAIEAILANIAAPEPLARQSRVHP